MYLTHYQLLQAVNEIACRYGGLNLGCVQGYRNQWLIDVHLEDMRPTAMAAAVLGVDLGENFPEFQVRCGFCQTNLSRAPAGGWSLHIYPDTLARCRSVRDVVEYFETWLGRAVERERKRQAWEKRISGWEEATPSEAQAMLRMVTRSKQEQEEAHVATA